METGTLIAVSIFGGIVLGVCLGITFMFIKTWLDKRNALRSEINEMFINAVLNEPSEVVTKE